MLKVLSNKNLKKVNLFRIFVRSHPIGGLDDDRPMIQMEGFDISSHAKLSTSSSFRPAGSFITAAIIATLPAIIAGCQTEEKPDIAPPLDSVIANSSIITLDSGVILVTTPDSTDSIHPAGPLVALNDGTKPRAVPIPNAGIDSLEIELQRAIDQLDSIIIPAEKSVRKR